MNITKNYLKSSEIDAIVRDMVSKDSYLQATISKDMMILYFCTDLNVIDDDGMIDGTFDTYDKYKEDGTIDKVLNEINENDLLLIDECYQHETSMSIVVREILSELNEKIDKYVGNINLQKVLKEMKEISKIDKKSN